METEVYDYSPEDEPTGERWDPLGAPDEECESSQGNLNYLCKHE